ncbi:MAG: hypothetical protein OHK0024_19830 [Thalassobaculales bacterium]
MEGFPHTLAVLSFFAKAAVLVGIPVGALLIGWRCLLVADRGGGLSARGALITGIMAGGVLGLAVLVLQATGPGFRLHDVLRRDGPWAIEFAGFLNVRVNPFLYGFDGLAGHIASAPFTEGNFMVLLAGAGLLLMLYLQVLRARAGAVGFLGATALVLWAAYAALFTACLVLWVIHLLNFWAFAVLGVIVQMLRKI